MSIDSLSTLLREAQLEVHRRQYATALKIVRDAKLIDLHNLYLSAIEHVIASIPVTMPGERTQADMADQEQLLSLLVERALQGREQREMKRSDVYPVPDERLLMLEKMKNRYFERADEFIERKEYGRAMEEVQRIYTFDPLNFVAKEYQQKIEQLADLQRK